MPGPEGIIGHSNGFDDDYERVIRSNLGDAPGLEEGPGGLFPVAGGPYPSNSDFVGAYNSFYGQSRDWLNGLGQTSGPAKDYE